MRRTRRAYEAPAMRLPRMTVRRWMIAVVFLAMAMAGIVVARRLKGRHDDLLSRAQYHADCARGWYDQLIRVNDSLRIGDGLMRQIEEHRPSGFVGRPNLKEVGSLVDRRRQESVSLF